MNSPKTPQKEVAANSGPKSLMDNLLGLLRIRLKRGVNLAVRDISSSDPYVIVKMGKQVIFLSSFLNFCFFDCCSVKALFLFEDDNLLCWVVEILILFLNSPCLERYYLNNCLVLLEQSPARTSSLFCKYLIKYLDLLFNSFPPTLFLFFKKTIPGSFV